MCNCKGNSWTVGHRLKFDKAHEGWLETNFSFCIHFQVASVAKVHFGVLLDWSCPSCIQSSWINLYILQCINNSTKTCSTQRNELEHSYAPLNFLVVHKKPIFQKFSPSLGWKFSQKQNKLYIWNNRQSNWDIYLGPWLKTGKPVDFVKVKSDFPSYTTKWRTITYPMSSQGFGGAPIDMCSSGWFGPESRANPWTKIHGVYRLPWKMKFPFGKAYFQGLS